MKLLAQEDIAAPLDRVWQAITDFEAFERSAMRRGVGIRRTDRRPQIEVGSTWAIDFEYRGKERKARASLAAVDPHLSYQIDVTSGGLSGPLQVALVELSKGRTRLSVVIEMAASNFKARLLLQTLKLARSTAQKRLDDRLTKFASEIEAETVRV